MSHAHHHNHHHHHHSELNKLFVVGIALNVCFVFVEAIIGLWVNSLSLLTDAGHNLGDVAGLVMVVIATRIAKKKPTTKYTYGFGKTTVLVALINAVTLLVMVGAIGWEAVGRFNDSHPVQGQLIAWVAAVGIIVNGVTALLFFKNQHDDLNAKGAYLHMAADALVSLGVLISGIVIFYTHWFWLDAAISLIIIVVIVVSSWSLLKDSIRLTLDGVPSGINIDGIRHYLMNVKGVASLHDLHIWAMSTNATAMTVHLVVPDRIENSSIAQINSELHAQFNIDHTTIQIEKISGDKCGQHCES
ncbi:MAG: cation transporter [Bacteroidetes bacterium]|nr:cation transporter [Bacteroidota bacterium]